MEFRDFDGAKVQRPSFDREDLIASPASFKGDFDLDLLRIEGGDQVGITGEGSISHTLVAAVKMSETRFGPLALYDVTFDDVDLSNAVLAETTVRRVELVHCRGIGLQLSLVQATDLYVETSQFDYATIRFGKVKNAAVFTGCSFREAVFIGDLSNVTFVDCEFAGAEFEATRAANCDFRSSRLSNVRGLLTLRGAKITSDQAISIAAILATECGLTVVD